MGFFHILLPLPLSISWNGALQTMTFSIAIAQFNPMVGDLTGNADRILALAARAKETLGARLVVFPELALTGYPPEDLLLRRDFLDLCEAQLQRLCRQARGIDLILGYPRRADGRLYNAAGLLRDGAVVAEYFKAELPNYSVFDEKRYFTPGEAPCVVEVEGVPMGITLCEDIWRPQAARRAAEAGARLILNLNASPYEVDKADDRREVVGRRVAETGLPVVYVNLVGGQDELVFDGDSFTLAGDGTLVQRSPAFQESLTLVRIDDEGRPQPGERAPALSTTESIYRALTLGIHDYVTKSGFEGVVLGLSGGIDSALTAALAVDALGPERVEVVLMPSRYTADMSNEDAVRQARTLGIEHLIIPIEPAFEAFLQMLQEPFRGLPMDVTEENIQARCRGIVLMAISNKTGRMLLTTGNKSEMSVGYATLYGDMAGGFAPIKDVHKLLVYQLAEYCNREREIIPRRVIERPPSAELAPDQKDSDSLPPYEILDEILLRYIERDQGVREIVAAGFDRAVVERVVRMVDRNEYKRRQAPPGVKITQRAFGRDRRYPITNGF